MADLRMGKGQEGAPLALPADALVTHGVCVGMTGSGKTGLCVGLLEEVAGAGIPVIALDPKGDLANLALPGPPPEDAAAWQAGQAAAGVTDVAAWRARVRVRVFTPGSDAGIPVDALGALRRPADVSDEETRRELVSGCVSALLGLVGESADPVRSPAHVVLSRILEDAWVAGHDPDLPAILQALVDPPFAKVGVFATEDFFPSDDRMDLAMRLNALLASPSFAAWAKGVALDIPALLAPTDGRTPINVFTLSHLSEHERHFFVGLLLDRVAAWTRTLPGTSKLRALVFFDEVWGYLPPHPKNPPAKRPLLTLLKQARAVGVGTVLATQNPVDLDYKALSNAGTWFVGRLQTRNDRDRVLEGLTGAGMERADAEAMLDRVAPRRFLLHRAGHAPTLFDTRWTRTFLAGPLTKPQLRALAQGDGGLPGWRAATPTPSAAPVATPAPSASTATASTAAPAPRAAAAPAPLPGRFPTWPGTQWALDPRAVFAARMEDAFTPWAEPHGDAVRMRPALLVRLALRFDEERAGFVEERALARVYFPLDDGLPLAPLHLPLQPGDLLDAPPPGARFDAVPTWLDEKAEVQRIARDLVDAVLREETAGQWVAPALKLNGVAGETREAFQARCEAAVKARVDQELAALQGTFARKVDAAEAKLARLEAAATRQRSSAESRQAEEWAHVGEAVLGFFTGGRKKTVTSFASKRRQAVEAEQRASEAQGDVARAREALYALETELEEKAEAVRAAHRVAALDVQRREIRLERDDARLVALGLLWIPVTRRL